MNPNQPVAKYAVDLVFVVDCTGSMAPFLDSVKRMAKDFHALLSKKMEDKDKGISQLRARVVAYRDIGEEGADAIAATPFYTLPGDTSGFESFVNTLTAAGGGDEPESALEALVTAIRSPWERGLDKRRHVIVVCTDASAHPLGKFSLPTSGQDRPMPADLSELESIWGNEAEDGEMDYQSKRLIVFAPNAYPWSDLPHILENIVWVESAAGQGMRDQDQDSVLEAIAGSV